MTKLRRDDFSWKKVKSFFPVEKAKKVTQSEKQSQSQHLVNLFSLSQHLVAFASRKWKKKKGCKMRYRIFPPYFRLWGSQCLCSFFKIHLREGCKSAECFCPQILCVFVHKYLCVDDLWTKTLRTFTAFPEANFEKRTKALASP